MVLDLDATDDTVIRFTSSQGPAEIKYSDIKKGRLSIPMGGLNLMLEAEMNPEVEVVEAIESMEATIKKAVTPEQGEHAYRFRVTQYNGNRAWTSPIFVNVK